jgi:hypothetical protein
MTKKITHKEVKRNCRARTKKNKHKYRKKGQCRKIFDLRFSHESCFLGCSLNHKERFKFLKENLLIKMHHQY